MDIYIVSGKAQLIKELEAVLGTLRKERGGVVTASIYGRLGSGFDANVHFSNEDTDDDTTDIYVEVSR